MRKYIIGALVGGALTFAVQAGAATLLDSKVDAIITVDVDGVSLGQAPVINGVSYLPVRKFGNEAGYKVNFGEGKATLTSEATNEPEVIVDPEPTPTPTPDQTKTPEQIKQEKLEALELEISAIIREQYPLSRESSQLTLETVNASPERLIEIEKRRNELATISRPLSDKLEALYKQKAELEEQQ